MYVSVCVCMCVQVVRTLLLVYGTRVGVVCMCILRTRCRSFSVIQTNCEKLAVVH